MEFTCSNSKCGQRLEIADEYAGQNAQCPFCQATVIVPVSLPKRGKGISRALAWSLGVVGTLAVVAAATIAFISTRENSTRLTHASAGDLRSERDGERAKPPTTNRNVTFGGSWAGEQPSAPHVNRVVFKRDTFPCEGEIRFSSSSGKLKFDERNTSFLFDGNEVKVLEHTNIDVVMPVSWDREGDHLVAKHAKAPAQIVAKVKLVGSFLEGETSIPPGIRTFLDGVAAIRIDRFQKVESGGESQATANEFGERNAQPQAERVTVENIPKFLKSGGAFWSSPEEVAFGMDISAPLRSLDTPKVYRPGNGYWIWPASDLVEIATNGKPAFRLNWHIRPGHTLYRKSDQIPQGRTLWTRKFESGSQQSGLNFFAANLDDRSEGGIIDITLPFDEDKVTEAYVLCYIETEPEGRSNLLEMWFKRSGRTEKFTVAAKPTSPSPAASSNEASPGDRSTLVAKGKKLAERMGLNPIALIVENDSIVMVDGQLRIHDGKMGLTDGDLVYNVDSKSIVVNEASLQPGECAVVRNGKVEKITERLTPGIAGAENSIAVGRWTGTTTNNTLWLRVSFEVVTGGSEMVGINYQIGHEGQGDDKPGVTWPSKGTARTSINSDGSFRFVDEHNNFIEGKFTSPVSAQGSISQGPFKLRCLDGVSRFPPTEWRATRE